MTTNQLSINILMYLVTTALLIYTLFMRWDFNKMSRSFRDIETNILSSTRARAMRLEMCLQNQQLLFRQVVKTVCLMYTQDVIYSILWHNHVGSRAVLCVEYIVFAMTLIYTVIVISFIGINRRTYLDICIDDT